MMVTVIALVLLLMVVAGVAVHWWSKKQAAAKKRMQDQVMGRRSKTDPKRMQSAPLQSESLRPTNGVTRYTSGPQVIVDGVHVKAADGQSVTVPMQLISTVSINRDEVFADLNRRATEARSNGDANGAVELLMQAKQRQGNAYEDTRLALYLQHAGRIDEAMTEFDWLLSRVDSQVEGLLSHCTPTTRKHAKAYRRSVIHDKARLASKRAGRIDLIDLHGKLADQFAQEAQSLKVEAERSERKKRERRTRKKTP